ncbi:Alpha amylase, partial [Operophtera brumata]
MGVDAIWLSTIYLSPMYDFGYDITDYRAIAPEYGTMEDFDELMVEAKRLGIRVVLDFVPNHTSNESEWFIKSARRDSGYEDYYIWANGTEDAQGARQPPNNWISIFRKSAWEFNAVRGQYYLHQFVIGQPDLNYRSAKVQQEMKDVLSFWLEKGVSGFRVDAINMMYEVDADNYGGLYPNEPLSGDATATPDDYDYLDHIYTRNLEETYDVVFSWRDLLEEFTQRDGESKVMMTEAYADLPLMIKYYGNAQNDGSVPFNFLFLEQLSSRATARDMKMTVDEWMTYMPDGKTANWVLRGTTVNDGSVPFNFLFLEQLSSRATARDMKMTVDEWMTYMPDGKTANWVLRGTTVNDGSVPFNFLFLEQLSSRATARDMKMTVVEWMTYMPDGKTANWVLRGTTVNDGSVPFNFLFLEQLSSWATARDMKMTVDEICLLASLVGVQCASCCFQGEELGMTDGQVSWEDTKDPQACNTDDPVNYWMKSRDPTRTPYHWDASANAGFSTNASTWLPVADNYLTVNLAAQMAATNSHYKFYKDVVAIKKSPAVSYGDLDTRAITENVLSVIRLMPNEPVVVALINLGDVAEAVDLSSAQLLPSALTVIATGVDCTLNK